MAAANQAQRQCTYCLLFLIAVITNTARQANIIFLDCDSPWHIAAGDLIRTTMQVPATDPWSFASNGHPWVNLAWLYDIGVSWLYEIMGMQGLVAVIILLAAIIPCLMAKLCFMRGCTISTTLIASILGMIAMFSNVSVRPQMISLILLACAFIILSRQRTRPSRALWLLSLITIIWANIHGSYLVMYIMIGSFFLEALQARDVAKVKSYIYVGLTCLVAATLTPLGYNIFLTSWDLMHIEYSKAYITEWQPSSLSNNVILYAMLMLLVGLAFFSRYRPPLADMLLVIFWLLMAMNEKRHTAIWAIFYIPIVAMMLSEILHQRSARMRRLEATLTRDFSQVNMSKQCSWAILVLIATYLAPPAQRIIISDTLYDPTKYPVEEISYLMQHHPGSRVLNDYGYGGFIIYQARGSIQPMIDGRIETAYPKQVIKDYMTAAYFKPKWQEIITQYELQLALFPNKDKTAKYALNKAGWREAFKGSVATVYEKRGPHKESPESN